MLRKRPPVAGLILSRVLSFPKRHVARFLDDTRATLLGMLEMSVHIGNGDVDVLGDGMCLRRAKRTALSTEHDCPFCDSQLCVTDDAIPFGAETF